MNRVLAITALLSACNLPTTSAVTYGGYRLAATINENTCSVPKNPIPANEVAVEPTRSGGLELFVPVLWDAPGTFGAWQSATVPAGDSSATVGPIRACSFDWTERVDVLAHDARSLHGQVTFDLTPEPTLDPCALPTYAQACTIGADLDYELVLPCERPCHIVLPPAQPTATPLSCACPDDGGT